VLVLEQAGLDPATKLGDAQFTLKGDEKIFVHGGFGAEGVANITVHGGNNSTLLPKMPFSEVLSTPTGLTAEGYVVNYGSSFILTVEFTDAGPHAEALLTYSESADPASPHFADQTKRFAEKAFRPIAFTDAEIAADPELVVTEISAPR
jgi:acyl-homoserine-lactone acylase